MRILVIDDSKEQLEHAKDLLVLHELVTANGWESGKEAIKKGGWDMVLTDLSMPAIADGVGDGWEGKPTPYGFPLALFALKSGVPMVGIVSNGRVAGDDNHHASPILWASDSIDGEIIPGRLWAFIGYNCPAGVPEEGRRENAKMFLKDWATVVRTMLLAEIERQLEEREVLKMGVANSGSMGHGKPFGKPEPKKQ